MALLIFYSSFFFLELSLDALGNFHKLLGSELKMRIGKSHICLALHGHQVDVGMRHLKTQYTLANLHTRDSLADSDSNLLGKNLKTSNLFIAQVKDIIFLALGDDKSMSLLQRIDIQEGKVIFVFGYLVARNLASYYA
jgi:hypothetical protein